LAEGKTLFSIEDGAKRGDIILFLLSDAGQIQAWPTIKPFLTKGKTVCVSHGFGFAYHQQTKIIPPADIDVVLAAPKGSGRSVRKLFTEGRGINSSIAVFQDATGKAYATACAIGIGIGSGFLFETTFEREVSSDLTGERGVLMGALAGMIEAQYALLRKNGHSPSEAFNETVEELTESLVPLVGEHGMDWMYSNCSTTAQRGALDWKGRFRKAVEPVFEELYKSVSTGNEAKITIEANSRSDYRSRLEEELNEIRSSELWRVGAQVRKLRP
jgi:ketol-acid reductoisomerase